MTQNSGTESAKLGLFRASGAARSLAEKVREEIFGQMCAVVLE